MRFFRNTPGFTLMQSLGALLVLAMLTPVLSSLVQQGIAEMRKRAVADHFRTVVQGAEKYARQRHNDLMTASTPTTGPAITLAMLRAANCLSDMVADRNAWGQDYRIDARRMAGGELALVILTTGGRGEAANDPAFANIEVPGTAALARAGFVPTTLMASAGNILRGAYGGWEVNLAGMGLTGAAGHLGTLTTLDSSSLAQDFLYRVAVPGQPELNAMQTELDMTDHTIRGVKEVQYVPHSFDSLANFCTTPEDEGKTFLDAERGLYLCRDGIVRVIGDTGNSMLMQDARVASSQQIIPKPECPAGSATHPEIFVAPSIVSATGASAEEAPPMASLQAWAVSLSDTEWQVFMRVLTSENNWISLPENFGRMMVMTSCVRDVEPEQP